MKNYKVREGLEDKEENSSRIIKSIRLTIRLKCFSCACTMIILSRQ